METQLSLVWRGQRGTGKRTHLQTYLENIARKSDINFTCKIDGTWFLKNDDEEGKSIPYEESLIHLGFDVARMSMSDKIFIQSILTRWTGQQDILLVGHENISTRYLVLYHAHLLSDESLMQLHETLEECPNFGILLTSEYPVSKRLRDYFIEIPVASSSGNDLVLAEFSKITGLPAINIWHTFFNETLETWKKGVDVFAIRTWIYCCLQRNLRWPDVIMLWIETIYACTWLSPKYRRELCDYLAKAESGGGWTLINSYRIPISWEYTHLHMAQIFTTAWNNRV